LLAELLVVAILSQAPDAGVNPEDPPGSLADVIDNIYDMAGNAGSPFVTWARPVKVYAGATVGLEGDSRAFVGASLNALRLGHIWGRVDALTLEGAAATNFAKSAFHWGVQLVQWREFVCRDPESRNLTVPLVYREFDFGLQCAAGEYLGYFLELLNFAGVTDTGHWGVRVIELGPLVDVLSNGRTIDVWRNRLELRVSPSVDWVWFGSAPLTGPSNKAAFRAVLGLRAAASSFGRDVRVTADVAWRPNLLDPTDQLVDGSVTLSTFFGPVASGREIGIMLGLRARGSYASKPEMVISSWADPGQRLQFGVDLVGELLWWKPKVGP
jgi:hypothetical protein